MNASPDEVKIPLSGGGHAVFTRSNISSMVGRVSGDRDAALARAALTLRQQEGLLAALIETTGMKPSNISSMLNGAGKNIPEALEALAEQKDALGAMIKDGPFSATNISSMLNGAGKNIPEALEALAEQRNALADMVEDGPFTATNISSMLHGAGKNLPEVVAAIHSRMDKLRDMTAIYEPSQLTTHLHECTAGTLRARIDQMHAKCMREMDNGTHVPPHTEATIAATSPAATRTNAASRS